MKLHKYCRINGGFFTALLFLLFVPAVFQCATVPLAARTVNLKASATEQDIQDNISLIQAKLLEGAEYLVGKTHIIVNNRKYTADCINTILAIYDYAGINLAQEFNLYSGNGVARLYQILDNRGLIYLTEMPVTGDIIFWDNTWDSNGDAEWNDPLTHAGMVVKADQDGNLVYIHYDYIKGIVYAKMNLKNPDKQYIIIDGKAVMINTPIQMKQKGKEHSEKWLAGQLVNAFGKGYLME